MAALAVILPTWSEAVASSDNGLPTSHPRFAAAVAKGQERRPIVSAVEAQAYADRITVATYGEAEARPQRPFHAVADGDSWKVVGSRPMDLGTLTGPITIVVRREDGTVRELAFTAAPAGWDAAILKRLSSGH